MHAQLQPHQLKVKYKLSRLKVGLHKCQTNFSPSLTIWIVSKPILLSTSSINYVRIMCLSWNVKKSKNNWKIVLKRTETSTTKSRNSEQTSFCARYSEQSMNILNMYWTDSKRYWKFWTCTEQSLNILNIDWTCTEQILNMYWTDSEHSEHRLNRVWTFWTLLNILNMYWTDSEHVLNRFWTCTEQILNITENSEQIHFSLNFSFSL